MSSTSWRVPMPGRLLGRPIKRLYRAGAPIRLYPRPARNLRHTAFGWTATGTDPHLALDLPRRTAPPSGLVRLRYTLDVENRAWGEPQRSEESRVGKEGVSTCRYRWSQSH